MEIDEIYKEWCGISRLENSVKLAHDSTEAIEFAEYYHKALKNNADSPAFADWLIENYSPYIDELGRRVLPKGKWRKDYTSKVYDTSELYLIFKGGC